METIYNASGVIGNSDFIQPDAPHMVLVSYEDPLPKDEQHNGIQGMRVEVYGDSLDSAFLEVWGPVEDAVRNKWNKICELSLGFLQAWWEE